MHGTNPIRPLVKGNGQQLEVQDIFATFQGEGPDTGTPAVFIRLGGCNLACDFCDTEFESFSGLSVDAIMEETERLAADTAGRRIRHMVVITGGEPFRQPIELLCSALLAEGFRVQIETNGTLYRPVDARVEIVCSPKNNDKTTGYSLNPELLHRLKALKFIISATRTGYTDIRDVRQADYGIPIYVQPMDEEDADRNSENLAYARALADRHGYHLSLQMHKIVGMP